MKLENIRRDYEIRYLRADGSLSLVYKTSCASDEAAVRMAADMVPKAGMQFEIWRGATRIDLFLRSNTKLARGPDEAA